MTVANVDRASAAWQLWRYAHWAAIACALAFGCKVSAAAAEDDKRTLPNYDNRAEEPTSAGDVALWVPRILLSPLYVVSEYVLRRPLGAMIAGAERAGLPSILYDFFVFGPDHEAGIVPIGFIDFGFEPSVGIYAFWDNALVRGTTCACTRPPGGRTGSLRPSQIASTSRAIRTTSSRSKHPASGVRTMRSTGSARRPAREIGYVTAPTSSGCGLASTNICGERARFTRNSGCRASISAEADTAAKRCSPMRSLPGLCRLHRAIAADTRSSNSR